MIQVKKADLLRGLSRLAGYAPNAAKIRIIGTDPNGIRFTAEDPGEGGVASVLVAARFDAFDVHGLMLRKFEALARSAPGDIDLVFSTVASGKYTDEKALRLESGRWAATVPLFDAADMPKRDGGKVDTESLWIGDAGAFCAALRLIEYAQKDDGGRTVIATKKGKSCSLYATDGKRLAHYSLPGSQTETDFAGTLSRRAVSNILLAIDPPEGETYQIEVRRDEKGVVIFAHAPDVTDFTGAGARIFVAQHWSREAQGIDGLSAVIERAKAGEIEWTMEADEARAMIARRDAIGFGRESAMVIDEAAVLTSSIEGNVVTFSEELLAIGKPAKVRLNPAFFGDAVRDMVGKITFRQKDETSAVMATDSGPGGVHIFMPLR